MIGSKDRGYYFGASDTDKIIGRWTSETWTKWWLQKLSINTDNFENVYTLAGTHFEHRILESLNIPMELDKQVILEDFRLRVNLDGNTEDCIYECKTHKAGKPFKMPQKYINQVQVQMFATRIHKAKIVVYSLEEADYNNFFRPIDKSRLQIFEIEYDPKWIQAVYLPKLMELVYCLKQGIFPQVA
jgi:hypothetical protein